MRPDDLQADLQLYETVIEQLEALIVAPERFTFKKFCDIDPDDPKNGCAKFRECPNYAKGVDDRCWHTSPGRDSQVWCDKFETNIRDELAEEDKEKLMGQRSDPELPSQLERQERDGRRGRYNVTAYAFGIVCEDCNQFLPPSDSDPETGVIEQIRTIQEGTRLNNPQAGKYQQCVDPCPFFGCNVPERLEILKPTLEKGKSKSEVLYVGEKRPPLGCPYGHEDKTVESNIYAKAQCFITRSNFARVQQQVLGLHMGLFAFIDPHEKLYYLSRHPYKNVHLAHFVYDPRVGWRSDQLEHKKSHLFFASRQVLAQARGGVDHFLERLRGRSVSDRTDFEWRHNIIYAEDGEVSSFCLRWLLEEAESIWGADDELGREAEEADGIWEAHEADNLSLKGAVTLAAERALEESKNSWYQPRGNHNEREEANQDMIPHRGEELLDSEAESERININEVGASTLERSLPGIGPKHAEQIIEYRKRFGDFLSKHEIGRIPGIGEQTLGKIKNLISIEAPPGNKIEAYLKKRHLLQSDKTIWHFLGLVGNEGARRVRGIDLLVLLGILSPAPASGGVYLATERFWRLVHYLDRKHPSKDKRVQKYRDSLLSLADQQRRAGRAPSVSVQLEEWMALIYWVATGKDLEASRAPMARNGCPAHIFLRKCFSGDKQQVETCARSWIVFPVFSYEPFEVRKKKGRSEASQVGFFLGTFDDSGCYELDGELDESKLLTQIRRIRRAMQLVGLVEASGTYFEDLASRSPFEEGVRMGKGAWEEPLNKSDDIQAVLLGGDKLHNLEPGEFVYRLEQYIRKPDVSFPPLALELSLFNEKWHWHLLTHRRSKNYDSLEKCRDEVRNALEAAHSGLRSLEVRIKRASEAGTALLIWTEMLHAGSGGIKEENPLQAALGELERLMRLDNNEIETEMCENLDGGYVIRNSDLLCGTLTGFRASVKSLSVLAKHGYEIKKFGLNGSVDDFDLGDDCVIPFSKVFKAQLDDFETRLKRGTDEAIQKNAYVLEEITYQLKAENSTGTSAGQYTATVRRVAFIFKEMVRPDKKNETAEQIYNGILSGNTVPRLKQLGLSKMVDAWFVVTKGESLKISPLFDSYAWGIGDYKYYDVAIEQHNTLRQMFDRTSNLDETEILRDDGVYWIMILSWIKHEGGEGIL